jgi:hypothetical protein
MLATQLGLLLGSEFQLFLHWVYSLYCFDSGRPVQSGGLCYYVWWSSQKDGCISLLVTNVSIGLLKKLSQTQVNSGCTKPHLRFYVLCTYR